LRRNISTAVSSPLSTLKREPFSLIFYQRYVQHILTYVRVRTATTPTRLLSRPRTRRTNLDIPNCSLQSTKPGRLVATESLASNTSPTQYSQIISLHIRHYDGLYYTTYSINSLLFCTLLTGCPPNLC
jgi:hypothetical protein